MPHLFPPLPRLAVAALLLLVGGCAAPGASPDLPNRTSPDLEISPASGAPGSDVRLRATGFPPRTPVEIGLGPPNSEYDVISRDTTDSSGQVEVTITVPAWVETGREYVFVVAGPRNTPKAISAPFRVTS